MADITWLITCKHTHHIFIPSLNNPKSKHGLHEAHILEEYINVSPLGQGIAFGDSQKRAASKN